MIWRKTALLGAMFAGLAAAPALAQNYGASTTESQGQTSAQKDQQNRVRIKALKARIAQEENSRPSTVHRTEQGGASTSADELISNGGLPTSGQGRRSVPIVRQNNRTQLVPQR